MDMKTYFLSLTPAERLELAAACQTSVKHLQNIAYGKRCGEKLAILLEKHSGRRVVCEILRPDVEWSVVRGFACGA